MKNQKEVEGKLRYDLLCFSTIDEMVANLTFSAESGKYSDFGWLEDSTLGDIAKYEAAMCRHVSKHMQGEFIDKDSGLPHVVCAMTNAMIVNELYRKFC